MTILMDSIVPKRLPELDPEFRPAVLENKAFLAAVEQYGESSPLIFAIEREDDQIAVYQTRVFPDAAGMNGANLRYIERYIKTVLWMKGGWRLFFCGPNSIFHALQRAYAPNGIRAFDASFMSKVYERPFTIIKVDQTAIPQSHEKAQLIGGDLHGCRIGFDAGGSDRKVAAVKDGEVVFSEEVVWHPKLQSDPEYHYREIRAAIQRAAEHLPRIDGIGVSTAGVIVRNRVMAASLFIKVPPEDFHHKVKDIYLNIGNEFGAVPVEVRNDGDVTALAGALTLNDTKILGIAMGTSEAAGYIDQNGAITGCLNELAFVPVDFNPRAMVDEWSGDSGCGVKYFSQDAVIKLAARAGVPMDEGLSPAEKLAVVQRLMAQGDDRAIRIYKSIGVYLGYTLAYYAQFYDLKHVLILGRVTSGDGGNVILQTAEEVLRLEFPDLAARIALHLPSENQRRVGQAIAAASLPQIKKN